MSLEIEYVSKGTKEAPSYEAFLVFKPGPHSIRLANIEQTTFETEFGPFKGWVAQVAGNKTLPDTTLKARSLGSLKYQIERAVFVFVGGTGAPEAVEAKKRTRRPKAGGNGADNEAETVTPVEAEAPRRGLFGR